jgi:hypothetical protein
MPTQTFVATPTLVGNNVKWKLCHTNPTPDVCGTSNGNYPDVTLGRGTGAHTFQVTISGDQTGKGIKFANDALVIKKGEPSGPGTSKQIEPPNGGGSKVLTFVDNNSMPNKDHPSPVVISYGLNFTDQNGVAVTSIDPDITNGGTNIIEPPPGAGGGRSEWDYANYLPAFGLGLVAGILLMLVVRYLRR